MTLELSCLPKSAAARRYNSRFVPTMIAYIVLIFAVAWAFPHYHLTGVGAYLLAVLPAIPLIGTILIVGLYLADEKDEFQRELLVQSLLWGIGATLAITTVWGFLELFAHIPHFQLFLAYPLFWFFVGLSTPILKRRYR